MNVVSNEKSHVNVVSNYKVSNEKVSNEQVSKERGLK